MPDRKNKMLYERYLKKKHAIDGWSHGLFGGHANEAVTNSRKKRNCGRQG